MEKEQVENKQMKSTCCWAEVEIVQEKAGAPFPVDWVRERRICTSCKRWLEQRVIEK